ncbi:MAG TPA: SPW repeat protein [Burkholderiales bacterium]|nr:SPW repeat protein [Burkholderiales bacterium]
MSALTRWHGWAVFALALWLAVSPWLTGYSEHAAATANAAALGLLLALAAHVEASCELSLQWLNLGGGIWLLMAPFVLGFDDLPLAAAHCVAVGAAASALAASSLHLDRQPLRR